MDSQSNKRANDIPTLEMLDSVEVSQRVLPLDNDKVFLLPAPYIAVLEELR